MTEAKRIKMYRIIPQLKTFKRGSILQSKIDLYFSFEPDEVEVGSGAANMFTAGNVYSFPQTDKVIPKESNCIFVEAAQFYGSDDDVYVRLQLLTKDKVVWVNLLQIPKQKWAFMIRKEQKDLIQKEAYNMFKLIKEA